MRSCLTPFIHHSSFIIPHFQFVGMNFWHNMQTAAGTGAFLRVALGFVAVAAALFYFKPAARARIRAAAVLFGLACAGLIAAALLLSYGADAKGAGASGAAYLWLSWCARLLA